MNETPLCINFQRYSSYLLSPDEVILFERLLFKQLSFGSKPFYYTGETIESETRIRRRRVEAILYKFEEMGFLDCSKMVKKNGSSKAKHFIIYFNVLLDDSVLSQIIDKESEYYKTFKTYISEIVFPF